MKPIFAPVGGTPLLPPSYVTVYFFFFLIFLTCLYIYFSRRRRPQLLWQKIRLLLVLAFVLKATVILGGGLLAAYWLVPAPSIRRTIPAIKSSTFSPTDRIEIVFDRPVSRSSLEKIITPEVPGEWVFDNAVYSTHLYRKLVFYPTYSLRPDTTYTVKLSGIRNMLKISNAYNYDFEFTTQASPKIMSVSPVSGQQDVDTKSAIVVTLDQPNDKISEFDFQFTPSTEFETRLDTTKKIYTLTSKEPLSENSDYNLKIRRSDIILNLEDESVVERTDSGILYDGNFATKQNTDGSLQNRIQNLLAKEPAKVTSITPQNGWSAVNVHSAIKITFDQAVDHGSSEQKFSISPKVDGVFSWIDNTLIFTPQKPLGFTTSYTVTFGAEAKSEFTTQNATTKLAVPAYLQKYTLSCEIAALRMALNFRGLNTTEDELIPKVGQDPTAHNGNVWGNPNNAFVGNIRGTQMKDGYGVHWAPIAKAARNYRNAQDFQGWSIEQLTGAISNGNPVVIWVYSHFGTPTSWNTPDGTNIYAVRDEHAVVAVGFVGPTNNPTQMIINDPLKGQVYWSRASFDKKWNIFGRSGVVVY